MHPVIRYRKQPTETKDRYGNPVTEWVTAHLSEVCLFAPGGNSESKSTLRNQTIEQPTAYFPGQFPDISVDDELGILGQRWQVIGEPGVWHPQPGGTGGTTVKLKKVQG